MTLFLALVVAPLILLTLCFAVEVFAGLRPLRRHAAELTLGGREVVIVIPAHNEEAGLRERLKRIVEDAGDRARVLVVADNCTDSTADIARSLGAEVVERCDPERRGKGFALDFAKRHLAAAPPEVVVVLDADCTPTPPALERLLGECLTSGCPCQATYLLAPVSAGSPTVQLSTFAFYIRNSIRQRGLQRLAGQVHLVGTGMAFPWKLFADAALATDNLVEDLELGLEMAQRGYPPRLVDDALVWSDAATQVNTFHQRRRWEGGFLQSALWWGPRSLMASLGRGDVRGIWAAISLFIPPFALLLMIDLVVMIGAALASKLAGAGEAPFLLLAVAMLLAGGALIAAWVGGGRRFVSLGSLARTPIYLAWKVPLYLGLIRRGAPKEWVRTGRN